MNRKSYTLLSAFIFSCVPVLAASGLEKENDGIIENSHIQTKEALCLLARQYEQGVGVEKNIHKAVEYYELAACNGSTHAQYILTAFYQLGLNGITRDFNKAHYYCTLAANQGFTLAISNLARLYEKGMGVEQNFTEAFRLYKEAADKGHVPAQSKQAFLYEKGLGVKKDIDKAIELYVLAAGKGDRFAFSRLKELATPPVPSLKRKTSEPLDREQEQGLYGLDSKGKRRKLA